MAYFTASCDPVKKNTDFAKSLNLDYPILSDPSKKVAKAYGVYTMGFAKRHTFYIDKAGKIAKIDTAVKPASSAEDMIANLAALNVPTR